MRTELAFFKTARTAVRGVYQFDSISHMDRSSRAPKDRQRDSADWKRDTGIYGDDKNASLVIVQTYRIVGNYR